ncbi:MAG: hypothetical protein ACE14L_07265 [Terriglobales bacterium]
MMRRACLLLWLIAGALPAFAGGPLLVGGPNTPIDGQPYKWNNSLPIQYRVDPGPLSTLGGVVKYDNPYGGQLVDSMFSVWHSVPTASISFTNAGAILPAGAYAGGDVQTVAQFAAVDQSCLNGTQSPIIFDADGSLFTALVGDPNVIGFTSPCALDAAGKIVSAEVAMNGAFVNGGTTYQLTLEKFKATFIHEFGHFIGLDHSQINENCLGGGCPADDLDGLPTMFPILVTELMGTLSADDTAWVSKLYPAANFPANYGTIKGTVLFTDGITPAQGVNVIARQVDNPATPQNESRIVAVSAVSGLYFTGNPGQSMTANYLRCWVGACPGGYYDNNTGGSMFGSRRPALIGYFEIPLPPGSYTLEVESILSGFSGGSSVGPLSPPIKMPGSAPPTGPITVTAGADTTGITIVLQGTPPRTDAFESARLFLPLIGEAEVTA